MSGLNMKLWCYETAALLPRTSLWTIGFWTLVLTPLEWDLSTQSSNSEMQVLPTKARLL